jgi:hypothetical protein
MNDKNEIKSNEKDIKIEQNENQNIISNEENKNISKKININKEGEILPEYYKDLVRVKLEFCEGWIHKSRVEKIETKVNDIEKELQEETVNKKAKLLEEIFKYVILALVGGVIGFFLKK